MNAEIQELSIESQRLHLIEQAQKVEPFDSTEALHKEQLLAWLAATPVFWRQSKRPDFPEQHIALLNVVLTTDLKKIALFEHIKAGILLCPGGHLDQGETLQECVARETYEELGVNLTNYTELPCFLSYSPTNTSGSHWEYWLPVFIEETTDFTKGEDYSTEYTGHRWYSLDEAAQIQNTHPYTSRLIKKLKARYTLA